MPDILFKIRELNKEFRLGKTVVRALRDVNLDILVGERDYISAISAKVGAEIDYNIAAYTLLYQMGRMNLHVVGI